jgi:hypothetical protein
MTTLPEVQIPRKAVSDGTDLGEEARDLLQGLNLLPSRKDLANSDGFRTAFSGPPDSVALIEAGATAATKWWSAGLGATVVVAWANVAGWWKSLPDDQQLVAIAGAAVATGFVAIAIGHLFASDVRGRAEASVATIAARAQVAMRMIEAAQAVYEPTPAASAATYTSLSPPTRVTNTEAEPGDEKGWLAIETERHPDGSLKYRVVKEAKAQVVDVSRLRFN